MSRPSTAPTARRPGRRLLQRNQRVEAHRSLVGPIAARYAARSPEAREDLEQVGLLGLIRAAELYDRRLAVPFSAYARPHVRGAILHHLRDVVPLVRESRRQQEQRQRHRQVCQELERHLGRTPSNDELRVALGVAPEPWLRVELRPWQERVWQQQLERSGAAEDHGSEGERADELLAALAELPDRQRLVVEAVVLQGQSLRAVARRMDSSAATVHRLLHRGLGEIRRRLPGPSAAPGC